MALAKKLIILSLRQGRLTQTYCDAILTVDHFKTIQKQSCPIFKMEHINIELNREAEVFCSYTLILTTVVMLVFPQDSGRDGAHLPGHHSLGNSAHRGR